MAKSMTCSKIESDVDSAKVEVVVKEEDTAIKTLAKEKLLCPVCLETCRTKPIYQCQNGHTICRSCIRQLHNCPICRACLPRDHIRNLMLEALLSHIDLPCPYNDKGCNEMILGSDMDNHTINCSYGKFVLCSSLELDCTQEISLQNIGDHMLTHGIQSYNESFSAIRVTYQDFLSSKTLKESTTLNWTPLLVKFNKTTPIIIYCELDIQKSLTATFCCVHTEQLTSVSQLMDGSDREVQSFAVEIIIGKDNINIPVDIKWEGKTVTYKEMKSGVASGCFKIPLEQYCSDLDRVINEDVSEVENNPPEENLPPSALMVYELMEPYMVMQSIFAPPPLRTINQPNSVQGSSSRRIKQVKRDLKILFRFAKTPKELQESKVVPGSGSIGSTKIDTYKAPKSAHVFRGIKCEQCKDGPLRGTRYRCMECQSFNLCVRCMNQGGIHSHHVFLCIRDNEQNTRVTRRFKRIYQDGPEESLDESDNSQKRPRKAPAKRRVPTQTQQSMLSASVSSVDNTQSTSTSTSVLSSLLNSISVIMPSAEPSSNSRPLARPC